MKYALVCLNVLALAAGAAMVAAAHQDQLTTARPGELTKGVVYIENQGPKQAIPVVVHDIETTTPIRVRPGRQIWEYRTVAITVGDDAARTLTVHGLEGWETTGLQVTDGTRILVLLKRPVER